MLNARTETYMRDTRHVYSSERTTNTHHDDERHTLKWQNWRERRTDTNIDIPKHTERQLDIPLHRAKATMASIPNANNYNTNAFSSFPSKHISITKRCSDVIVAALTMHA